MSRKRIRSQEPLDSGVSATTKSRAVRKPANPLRKKSDAKNATAKNPASNSAVKSVFSRVRVVVALALLTMLIATTGILAQRGKQKTPPVQNHTEQGRNTTPPTGELSTESLTSPSLWSKEYIHGPGGKVIATEERLKFGDVDDNSQFYEDIYRIAARGVTLGCAPAANPPLYCPDHHTGDPATYGYVTREQMAAFIMRALGEFNPPPPSSQRFADVLPSNPFYNFIDRLAALGITVGCDQDAQGNLFYCPAGLVTHEQMAAFMDRAIGVPNPPQPQSQTFCDVPATNVFYAHIEYYANSRNPIIWPGCDGVGNCPTGGCNPSCTTGRCFCPCRNVTRREMAHILVRAFGI